MLVLRSPVFPALAALALLGASACDSRAHTSPAGPTAPEQPAAQDVAVQVTPPTPTVATGATYQFAAAVTGTADTRVTWSVAEGTGGSISPTGLYTAPGAVGAFHVRATSVADVRAFGEATVTVAVPTPVSVTVTPGTGAVDACKTLQLTANVANATNRAVTWTIQEGAAGGTVSASGLYTAPSAAGVYHAVATSVQDATRSAIATITVSDHVLSVTVSPATVTLQPGQTQQFTATVTTSCGATTTTQSVTAPL